MIAIRALLDGLIDYAGLFPPASLDMSTAVRNYAGYRSSENAWALGRFVVPVQRLNEFSEVFADACCEEQASPWLLSVLGSGDGVEDAHLIAQFSEGAVFLDSIELKASAIAEVEHVLSGAPSGMKVYVEFPPELCEQMLPVLAKYHARAKVRTGGITAAAFPSVEQLTQFLVSCASAQIAFKPTAGLHHPLRSVYRLTYEPDSNSTLMHGFVNVFVAATIAYSGAAMSDMISVLQEQNPAAFQWSENALIWRSYELSAEQIGEVREKFAISFGSCSFNEPVDDLKALGWL